MNIVKLISSFFINIIILSNGMFINYLYGKKIVILNGFEIDVSNNIHFLIMFLIFGVISSMFLKNETIGDYIFKLQRNKDYKNIDNKFVNYINLFYINVIRVLLDMFFVNIIRHLFKKGKK